MNCDNVHCLQLGASRTHWELDGGIIKRLSLSPPANLFPALHHHANRVPVISAYKEHGGEEASLEPPEMSFPYRALAVWKWHYSERQWGRCWLKPDTSMSWALLSRRLCYMFADRCMYTHTQRVAKHRVCVHTHTQSWWMILILPELVVPKCLRLKTVKEGKVLKQPLIVEMGHLAMLRFPWLLETLICQHWCCYHLAAWISLLPPCPWVEESNKSKEKN